MVQTSATEVDELRLRVLEAVVDTSDDAVLSLDPDGRITRWNHGAERIVGCSADDAVGELYTGLFAEHLREEAALLLSVVAAGDVVRHHETEIERRDGLPVPVSISLCPVLRADGDLAATLVVARDITEQRLAQATLAEVDTRLRESEALAHIGGWLWDVRTGAVQWTDELHRIHGVDPLDFGGTLEDHLACVHPDDRERVRAAVLAAAEQCTPFEDEYRIVPAPGATGDAAEVRWIYARGEPTVGSAGDVVGVRGIGQDVTLRRGRTSP